MVRYEVKFHKLVGGLQVRTQTTVGFTQALPEPGHSFVVYSESPFEADALRIISTSPVESVSFEAKNGKLEKAVFRTKSGSVYQLDILEEKEVPDLLAGVGVPVSVVGIA